MYRWMLPPRAKSTLRLWLQFDERDRPPSPIERFDERAVVVLAPHMDDEVVGCGGVIRLHVRAGAKVTIVFLTDGRRGNPDLYRDGRVSATARHAAEERLVETRKAESREAASILGVDDLVFLDAPDGALEPTAAIVAAVSGVLRRVGPTVVYAPSVFDAHEDHWAANRILRRCLQTLALDPAVVIRGYEAWTPLLVNRVAVIDDVVEEKREALSRFASQIPHLDVLHAALGLAQYRAIHVGRRRGWAEAFHESTPAEYRALMDRFAER